MSEYPGIMDAYNKAISEGLSNEDAMNAALAECGTEQERVALLTAALGTQYSVMGQQFQEANEVVEASRIASDELMQSQSKLAEKIAPLQTSFKSLAADGIGFLADNLEWIAPIAGAAAVSFGILAVALNFTALTQALSGAIGVLNAVMALNPAVLVAAGLIVLVTAIVSLWNNCDAFKNFWLGFWDDLKATARKGVDFLTWVGDTISLKIGAAGAAVSNTFSNIYTAITGKISAARDFVGNAVNAIKGFFNFEWSLPQIKLPHFSVSGGQAPWGFMGQGSLPSVSVSWYAKAMNRAMVLDSPTIFGFGNGSLLGGGEAGREIVSGERHLVGLIGNAVQKAVSNVSNHNEINVTVHAQGDPDAIANAVAYKVFNAIDEANTRNGR